MKKNATQSVKTLFVTVACAGLLLAFLSGCGDISRGGSSENRLLEFKLEKAHNPGLASDVIGTINEAAKTVTLIAPNGTDVAKLKVTFSASKGAMVFVKDALQHSTITENDFTYPFRFYNVIAENGSKQEYMVQIEVAPASGNFTGKRLASFDFKKDINPGLSEDVLGIVGLNRTKTAGYVFAKFPAGTAEATIKALKPTFTASHMAKVTLTDTGTELTSMQTAADFYNLTVGTKLTVTAQDGGTTPYNVAIEIDLPKASKDEVEKYFGSYYTFIAALNSKAIIVLEWDKVTLYSTAMSMDYKNMEWEKKDDGSYTCTTYKKKLPQIKNAYGKGGYDFIQTGDKITVKTNIMGGDVTATKGPDFTWSEGSEYKQVSLHI